MKSIFLIALTVAALFLAFAFIALAYGFVYDVATVFVASIFYGGS